MKTFNIVCAVGAAALLASACNEPEDTTVVAADETLAVDPITPADDTMVLGMTTAQVEDADVVSADGTDIGDVERVVVDSTGQVTGLAVWVDGAADGEYVLLPITGLTTRADGMDNDVQTTMTVVELQALPVWTADATGSM